MLTFALVVALLGAACGGDDDEESAPTTTSAGAADEATTTAASADGETEEPAPVDGPAFCSRAEGITALSSSSTDTSDPAALEAEYQRVGAFFSEAAGEAPDDVAPSFTVLATYVGEIDEVFGAVDWVVEDVPEEAFALFDADIVEATGVIDRWFAAECGVDVTPDDDNGAEVDEGGNAALLPSELVEGAAAPGPDAALDELWVGCADGDDDVCDQLYSQAPIGSQYEGFGATCGARRPFDPASTGLERCGVAPEGPPLVEQVGGNAPYEEGTSLEPGAPPPGPDDALDALWVSCGEGGLAACDQLYADTPVGSLYEAYAMTCGGRDEYDPTAYMGCQG